MNTERQLRHVDLCSGIGGFSLGFEWAGLSKPILFCDTEKWCREILAKNFPNVPIATDVKELANDPERLVPDCDILTAGYPCQPFSVAGKQKGSEDDRHIWPYILRIVAQKRPTWCVFENVYGHIALGLDKVLFDLESEGYSTRTFVVPACGVNAPHRRDRLWIIAHSELAYSVSIRRGRRNSTGCETGEQQVQSEEQGRGSVGRETKGRGESYGEDVGNAQYDGSLATEIGGVNEEDARGSSQGQSQTEQSPRASGRENDVNVADSTRFISNVGEYRKLTKKRERQGKPRGEDSLGGKEDMGWNWLVEPNVGRVAHGVSRRVDRLKGLGNAIVPQIAMNIGLAIKEQEDV